QFWADELFFHQWRIQRNAVTGHYRLLDERNQRRAWGTFDQCRARLTQLKEELQLEPVRGPVVLALHGVIRSRNSMTPMIEALRKQTDWTVLNVSYASTRDTLDAHAAALGRIIDNLDPEVTEIHFVAHSLGNLVIRRYLHTCYAGEEGRRPDPRLGRIVMLAPPNNGARFAEALRKSGVLEWVWGKSTVQLAEDWETLEQSLATPQCEFGILAGGEGDDRGRNRLLAGDDDFVVSVEETKLPGARDFLVLPVYHGLIMRDRTAQEATVRFLKHGYFVSPELRQPIPLAVGSPP
ncbi:MAG: hypothetical protein JJ992_06475, partial [Planctomycetes bacterium]|nr:hypothetical protein [Planctomycetota bacterium]